jgi:hypothetical protein
VTSPWLQQLALQQETRKDFLWLLQLRVLCSGLLQDGDVGVGVFPEGEEIFVGSLRFGAIADDLKREPPGQRGFRCLAVRGSSGVGLRLQPRGRLASTKNALLALETVVLARVR